MTYDTYPKSEVVSEPNGSNQATQVNGEKELEQSKINNLEKLNPTSKTLLELAKACAEKWREVDNTGLSRTAHVLLFDLFPPDLDKDHADRIIALNLVINYMTGAEQNAVNLLMHEQDQPYVNSTHMAEYLADIEKSLHASPDSQFFAIHRQIAELIQYITDNFKSELHEPIQQAKDHAHDFNPQLRDLLNRVERLTGASKDLINSGKLMADPKLITEMAYLPLVGRPRAEV